MIVKNPWGQVPDAIRFSVGEFLVGEGAAVENVIDDLDVNIETLRSIYAHDVDPERLFRAEAARARLWEWLERRKGP